MKRTNFILVGTLVGLFLIILVSYSYSRFKEYLLGPQITIESPENGEILTSPLASIDGTASDVAFITLNDRQIFVNESGHFSEKLLLAQGYNIMRLSAKDRFGRVVEQTLELVYQQPTTEIIGATSTPSSTL